MMLRVSTAGKKAGCFILFLCLLGIVPRSVLACSVKNDPEFLESICNEAKQYTVLLRVPYFDGNDLVWGTASGVVVTADGYVLTSAHSLETRMYQIKNNNPKLRKEPILAILRPGEDEVVFEVNTKDGSVDISNDIALLKPSSSSELDLEYANICIPAKTDLHTRKGKKFAVFGFPLRSEELIDATGRIVGPGINDWSHLVQVETPLVKGMSGGPLVSTDGELIALSAKGFESDLLKFAVPISSGKKFFDKEDKVSFICAGDNRAIRKKTKNTWASSRDRFLKKKWKSLSSGWVATFRNTLMDIDFENGKFKTKYEASAIYRNEGSTNLSRLVFTDIRLPEILGLEYRVARPKGAEVVSVLDEILELDSESLDIDNYFSVISTINERLHKGIGTKIDKLEVTGKDIQDTATRIESEYKVIKLVGNRSTLRIDDLREVVSQGESIVITLRIELAHRDLDTMLSGAAWLGTLTPYPTRTQILGMRISTAAKEKLKPTEYGHYVEFGDGTNRIRNHKDRIFIHSDDKVLSQHFFLPQHARQEINWDWQVVN